MNSVLIFLGFIIRIRQQVYVFFNLARRPFFTIYNFCLIPRHKHLRYSETGEGFLET